jgi:hypothetical protein
LPHFHRCLYIFGIRKHMDYSTGITGIARQISYKSLAEEVYVAPRCGMSNTGSNSRDQVKRGLILLEEAGLITRQSIVTKDEKQLILKCLLAETDESVQNKAAPLPPHSPAPEAALVEDEENTAKTDISSGSEEKSRPASRPTQILKPAPHPVSGINTLSMYVGESYPQEELRQIYIDMLQTRNYKPGAMLNPKTGIMLNTWLELGVQPDDVKAGIEYAEAKEDNGVPASPHYYTNFVISAMKARLQAKNEVKHHATHQRNPKSTKTKSKTEMFYDECLPGFFEYLNKPN